MAGLGGTVEVLVLIESDQILQLFQAGPTLHKGNPIVAIYLISLIYHRERTLSPRLGARLVYGSVCESSRKRLK
ncbi:hypothetical protein D3C80_1984610 [compost metagenome]